LLLIDVFCGGCQDGSIKVWDARISRGRQVLNSEIYIPNTHGKCIKLLLPIIINSITLIELNDNINSGFLLLIYI